jgi:hypothetical protein
MDADGNNLAAITAETLDKGSRAVEISAVLINQQNSYFLH